MKRVWSFLGTANVILWLVLSIMGMVYMFIEDYFQGFVIMTLSLILFKLSISDTEAKGDENGN